MYHIPVGKIAKKRLKECVFVNSALKIRCRIVKNTLQQTAFSVILSTGYLFENMSIYQSTSVVSPSAHTNLIVRILLWSINLENSLIRSIILIRYIYMV